MQVLNLYLYLLMRDKSKNQVKKKKKIGPDHVKKKERNEKLTN